MRCDALSSNTVGTPHAANYFDGDFLGSGNDTFPTVNAINQVGAYGTSSASYYGTSDQGGNVWEWTDAIDRTGRGSTDGLRGGSWYEPDSVFRMSSSSIYPSFIFPEDELARVGFRIAAAPTTK
jgi:formylglycine-generating enzyme required for sulfatase activity